MMPLPRLPEAKQKLWSEFSAVAPEVLSTINTYRDSFAGSRVVSITLNGETFGDPADFDPDKTFAIDDDFINNRLSAAERTALSAKYDNKSVYQRAVDAKKTTKGKKR